MFWRSFLNDAILSFKIVSMILSAYDICFVFVCVCVCLCVWGGVKFGFFACSQYACSWRILKTSHYEYSHVIISLRNFITINIFWSIFVG